MGDHHSRVPLLFTNVPERILIGFYKEFFSQERLFASIANEYRFVEGAREGSLVINTTEDVDIETTNALPSLLIGSGGWSETIREIDSRDLWQAGGQIEHHSFFTSVFSVTAITANKGSCEVLQGLAALALIKYRRAIYELGIERISEPQGQAAQKLGEARADRTYAASFTFTVVHQHDWVEREWADQEKKIRAIFTGGVGLVEPSVELRSTRFDTAEDEEVDP
jgi:hypothetical protein